MLLSLGYCLESLMDFCWAVACYQVNTTETATSNPPVALIFSPASRLVCNIFSTSELNVIFITIADISVIQVQEYSYLCYF